MIDANVAPALRAITTIADVAALEFSEELRAFRQLHVFSLPQRERAHRRRGIAAAVLAVAVTHLQRFAVHLDLHSSAVTSACMRLWHDQDIYSGRR